MDAFAYRPLSLGFVLSFALIFGALTAAHAQSSGAAPTAQTESEQGPEEGLESAATPGVGEADAQEPGRVHLVIFEGPRAVSGAIIRLPNGREFSTNDFGSVDVELPAGTHTLQLIWPPDSAPRAIAEVVVAAGTTTEVIATVPQTGELQLDIMAPEGAEEAAEAAQAAAELGTGTLTGLIVGEEDGKPVEGAYVYVAGQPVEARTTADGRFSLTVTAGTHLISVIHPNFSQQRMSDIEVTRDGTTHRDIALTPRAIELEEFVISAPHIAGGVASLLDDRRKSAAVSDSIGAEDIARMPASNAAQAAQRSVGVTIVNGRFVYVRGLGERYSNALLNGAPLPSPEPDRAAVPLDLFPAQVIDSLEINKTFTPDVPADFAGGSVRINTKSVPEDFLFGASISVGANSQVTGKKAYGSNHRGTWDWLGFDDGSRDLDSSVPTDYKLAPREEKPDGTRISSSELEELARSVATDMSLQKRTIWPDINGSVAIGNGWKFGNNSKAGVLSSIVYRHSYDYAIVESARFAPSDSQLGGIQQIFNYEGPVNEEKAVLGLFLSGMLEFGKNHSIKLTAMRSQLADTNTLLLEGVDDMFQGAGIMRQQFLVRALTFGTAVGRHTFPFLHNAELSWVASLAAATRVENDTKDLTFLESEDLWYVRNDTVSPRHFYSDQSEEAQVGGLNWEQPIVDTDDLQLKLKAGGLISLKQREFSARAFKLQNREAGTVECGETLDIPECSAIVYAEDRFGEDLIRVQEVGLTGDAYEADLNVHAGYLMGEVALGSSWRFIGGARAEHTLQELRVVDLYTGAEVEREEDSSGVGTGKIDQTDLLPAIALVWNPMEQLGVRMSVARTLARPQLRETAPFVYNSYFGELPEAGYTQLKLTSIMNYDVRVEFFPSGQEVVAVSAFYKDFTDPIEPTQIQASDSTQLTYRNALGAKVYGVEFEMRKNLGFLTSALADFGVLSSVMLAKSEIEIEQQNDQVEYFTNTKRPLVLAAPYVFNFALDYENQVGTQVRALYYVNGPRLRTVGTRGVPDAYEHPWPLVDITASQMLGEHFKVRMNLRNLLNSEWLITQGKREASDYNNVIGRYREGASVSLSLSYSH